jgi:hypothetical protein
MPRLVVLAVVLIALVAAGCGNDDVQTRTVASTEGLYTQLGGLTYQIQLSRYVNANDVEDREYLKGLPDSTAQPSANETWFGVWVRVQNQGDKPLPAADTWEIRDTQDNVFRPIPIDTEVNVFAFEPGIEVPPNTVLPLVNSAAGQGPIQGSLLLFKVKTDALQNRPLELRFSNGQGGEQAIYDLDV